MSLINSKQLRRRLGSAGAAVGLAVSALAIGAAAHSASASASIVRCKTVELLCTQVTSLPSGQTLHFRAEPSQNSTGYAHPAFSNGDQVGIDCWVRGATYHGDHFWFFAVSDQGTTQYTGWLPDYFLATGSYSQWRPLIPHC
jgi:hypothetical protein